MVAAHEQLAAAFLDNVVTDVGKSEDGRWELGDDGWIGHYTPEELVEFAIGQAEEAIETAAKAQKFLEAVRGS